jgi:hypothetical protein
MFANRRRRVEHFPVGGRFSKRKQDCTDDERVDVANYAFAKRDAAFNQVTRK